MGQQNVDRWSAGRKEFCAHCFQSPLVAIGDTCLPMCLFPAHTAAAPHWQPASEIWLGCRQSTRPAPQRHQAHQPGTVANLLHMLDSCILLHGWDGGPEQPAKALQLAYQLCALGAQVGVLPHSHGACSSHCCRTFMPCTMYPSGCLDTA